MEQHAPGPLQVAEDPPSFRSSSDSAAIAILPKLQFTNELFLLMARGDAHEHQEQLSKFFGIGALGTSAAPGESLTLNMNQTALDDDPGPGAL